MTGVQRVIPSVPKTFAESLYWATDFAKGCTPWYTVGMGYVVAHCRKVSTVGLGAVVHHNARQSVYDEELSPLGELPEYITHPERARYNEGDGVDSRAVYKRRSDIIKLAQLGRKPQKNAAAAVEFSISASPEFFKSRKPKEWKAYFSDVRDFLGKRYGSDLVVSWNVHCDETTPHMHLLMVPIINTPEGLKYSSGRFLGGLTGLRALQTEIYEQVGRKWGLERGIEGSGARHTNQKEWLAQRVKEIEKKEKALEKREKRFEKTVEVFEDSRKNRMRGWKMPAPKVLESAKAYRDRVDPEVSGKIVRALEQIDSSKADIKKAVDEAVAGKEAHLKVMSDTCYRLDREGKEYKRQAESATQKYQTLRMSVVEAKTEEDFQRVKKAVLGQSQNRDRGLTR